MTEESRQTACAAHRLRGSAGQAVAQWPARLLQEQLIANHKIGAPRGLMRLASAKNVACVWKHWELRSALEHRSLSPMPGVVAGSTRPLFPPHCRQWIAAGCCWILGFASWRKIINTGRSLIALIHRKKHPNDKSIVGETAHMLQIGLTWSRH